VTRGDEAPTACGQLSQGYRPGPRLISRQALIRNV
jgi:hypothetical protein